MKFISHISVKPVYSKLLIEDKNEKEEEKKRENLNSSFQTVMGYWDNLRFGFFALSFEVKTPPM